MKIMKKTQLRTVLHSGNFERIAIWKDGSWVDVDGGYEGEQDGNNPVAFIARSNMWEPTHAMISAEFQRIEGVA